MLIEIGLDECTERERFSLDPLVILVTKRPILSVGEKS